MCLHSRLHSASSPLRMFLQALEEDLRVDGRTPFEMRPLDIKARKRFHSISRFPLSFSVLTAQPPDLYPQFHKDGTAEVQVGKTRVVAVVSAELVCRPPSPFLPAPPPARLVGPRAMLSPMLHPWRQYANAARVPRQQPGCPVPRPTERGKLQRKRRAQPDGIPFLRGWTSRRGRGAQAQRGAASSCVQSPLQVPFRLSVEPFPRRSSSQKLSSEASRTAARHPSVRHLNPLPATRSFKIRHFHRKSHTKSFTTFLRLLL